jgi:hypothetical protein
MSDPIQNCTIPPLCLLYGQMRGAYDERIVGVDKQLQDLQQSLEVYEAHVAAALAGKAELTAKRTQLQTNWEQYYEIALAQHNV